MEKSIVLSEAFVYLWSNEQTGRMYIGSHKGNPYDGYVCSSKIMLEEYQVNPDIFSRQILSEGSLTEMRDLEAKILKALNVKEDPMFYNQHNGNGDFYCKGHSMESRQKMSVSQKGNKNLLGHKQSGETRKKMSDAKRGENNPMFGRKVSEETREKRRQAQVGRKRTFSEEHIKNLVKSKTGMKYNKSKDK
jgi:hypothetical protein